MPVDCPPRPIGLAATALLATLAIAPVVARAECAGDSRPRWLVHQSLVALLNPMGAEHNARFGLCVPLFDSDDPVLELNHFEIGASTYLSPIYFVPGGYVQIAPVSFLLFRAEIAALTVWPIPLEGAGFYPRDGYDQTWNTDDLPVSDGASAVGWSSRLLAVLRGKVALGPGIELIAFDAFWAEIDVLDHGDYWVDVRDDVIAANGAWIVANEAAVLLEARPPGGPGLRFGAFSALRGVPEVGYVNHRLGPMVMLSFERVDPHVASVDVFVRLGVYTHHRFREQQASTMAGVAVDWDLGAL